MATDRSSRVDVETRTVIDRPVADVAAFAADPSNAPEWYENIVKVEWKSAPPVQVGSVVSFEARFLGRTLCYDYEVVELVPGERLVMRTSQGPFPMQTVYTWREVAPNRTEMILRNTGEPSGFSKFAAPLMAVAMRRANRKDLAALNAILTKGSGGSNPGLSGGS